MEYTNDNPQESRKKWLAPLIVLLLSIAALTGAAYAYTSMLTTSDDIDSDYYDIQIANGTGTASRVLTLTDDQKIVFDSESVDGVLKYKVNTTESATITVTVSINGHDDDTTDFHIVTATSSVKLYKEAACTNEITAYAANMSVSGKVITITFTGSDIDYSALQDTVYLKLIVDTANGASA